MARLAPGEEAAQGHGLDGLLLQARLGQDGVRGQQPGGAGRLHQQGGGGQLQPVAGQEQAGDAGSRRGAIGAQPDVERGEAPVEDEVLAQRRRALEGGELP